MRSPGMLKIYNQVALKIMNNNQIIVNDLYSLVLPKISELQINNNVHFKESGSEFLADLVVKSIMESL